MKKEFILSIETSGNILGIGISDTEKTVAKIEFLMPNLHDRLLAKTVQNVMSDLKITFDEIKAVAVAAGGSFTGLRIGLAFAKAICFDGAINFIPVPVLDAFALQAKEYSEMLGCTKIIATVPSHKNLIYYREYSTDLTPLGEIQMEEMEEFQKMDFSNIFIAGDFISFDKPYKTIKHINSLSIENIMKFADIEFSKGNFSDSAEFIPIYVQDFIPKGYNK